MAKQPSFTPGELAAFLRKKNPDTGKRNNQSNAAKHFGCTRQHISWVIKTYPQYFEFLQTARKKALTQIPWDASTLQYESEIYRRIRDHAEYMATKGKGMEQWKLRRLWHFYNKIETENLVVEFDPAIEPNEDAPNGGFAFRPWRESDGNLIIRDNEHAKLNDEGKWLWVRPPRKPSIR